MAEETNETKINTIEATKGEKKAVITYDFGGALDAAVEKFGKDVVYANFVRSAVITAQAAMRRLLVAGKGQEDITAKMAAWKPGVPLERVVDVEGLLMSKVANMTPEEKNALIEKLMAQ